MFIYRNKNTTQQLIECTSSHVYIACITQLLPRPLSTTFNMHFKYHFMEGKGIIMQSELENNEINLLMHLAGYIIQPF